MGALLCFDRRIVGENGCFIFIFNFTIDIVVGNLDYQGEHNHYADQVGDHHQTVKSIGQIPCQGGGHHRTEQDGSDVDQLEDEGGTSRERW